MFERERNPVYDCRSIQYCFTKGLVLENRKDRMLRQFLVLCVLCSGSFMVGQQKPTPPTHPTSGSAHAAAATGGLPSEETVNAFMQQMFGYDPSLSWKIVDVKPGGGGMAQVDLIVSGPQGQQASKLYVTPDGKHAISGELIPFGAHPFVAAKEQLAKGVNGPSRGPANAVVTLVEFSDLQCPHCKQAQPTVDKLLNEEKNVKLIFQSFPLPSHDWAAKAAYYADCISRTSNDAFWRFIQSTYDAQNDITAANADEKLKGIADASGAKSADVAACAEKPDTAGRVERSVELGKSLEVTGTPTAFVNGRKVPIGGMPYDTLKLIVENAAKEK
jgi:protein-disulfide isomerase